VTTADGGNDRSPAPGRRLHARPRPRLRRRQLRARRAVQWLSVLAGAAVLAFLVRSFAIETFYVPSGSMTPTLLTGDRILVDKLPWVRDNIQRGDIIVFRRVRADPQTQDADLVKRVIGLPGETISSRGDTVLINGKPISEPWLPNLNTPIGRANGCPEAAWNIKPTKIPPNHYYVMGDCRYISYDSRYWGTVPASHIIGKVFLVIWQNGHPWWHWF
jgi:signal peptidase I